MRLAVMLSLVLGMPLVTASAQEQLPDTHYKLAWADEFNGTGLDRSLWQYRTDSKMLSTQTAENVTVEGGFLTIHLRKQTMDGKAYTGGGVISRKAFRYGYYEARLKIVAGSGWHSSFWMMLSNGHDTQGADIELDAIENQSKDLGYYEVNVHRWLPTHKSIGKKGIYPGDLSKNFHTFGCEYLPDVIKYYLDGKLVQTVDWTGQPQGLVDIWLSSIAEPMGPNHDVDDTALPGKMIVDWVRFYEK